MSNLVIGDYAAAATIDGSTHYLLIQPGSSATAYKRINRNVLLGVSGQPADISTAQNITNKTLDNTNTITLKDTLFTLQDNLDTTKQAAFQLSGITTGTTRTYTLPNASSTIADTSTAQIFTNKTLTSPAITGGTYDNGTITVDSIAGHTSATIVTVGGVQMNNGTIGTSGAVTSTSIAAGAVQPQALVTGTGTGWVLQSYTPTLTNVTLGNGTLTTRYIQIGKMVWWRGEYLAGSTSSVSGTIQFSLPVTARTDAGYETTVAPIGDAVIFQIATNQWPAVVYITNSTTVAFQPLNAASTNASSSATANATNPFSWSGANGGIIWNVFYEAA